MNEQDLKYLISSYQRASTDLLAKTVANDAKVQQLSDIVDALTKKVNDQKNEIDELQKSLDKQKTTRSKKTTSQEDAGSF